MLQQVSLSDQLSQPGSSYRKYMEALTVMFCDQQLNLDELLQLTTHQHNRTAFHAGWLLECLILKHSEKFADHIPTIIYYGAIITNQSCQRHFAKVYSALTDRKAPIEVRTALQNIDLEPIVEQCFDRLIDPKTKVAVKVFAAETLCNLSGRYDWIAEELIVQLQYLMQNGSPAIQSAGRRLLNSLRRR